MTAPTDGTPHLPARDAVAHLTPTCGRAPTAC